MSGPGTALVLGVTGVTGTPFAEQLLTAGWAVYGVSRRPPELKPGTPLARFRHLPIDLQDTGVVDVTLRSVPDITHVFHCANAGSGEARLRMMRNLLDALERYAPDFRNIGLLQGMKYYGCHLGPFRTPAGEDDPRPADNTFYNEEEDLIRRRQSGRLWSWTALRPHSVCGYASGNPLNLALAIAIYGSLRRERGEPFSFPATAACFRSLFQVMDADMLARAAIHVATTPACANTAFNVSNGDIFRWQNMWPSLGDFFGLTAAGPSEVSLGDFFSQHQGSWERLARKHDLRPFPFERLPAWVRGDYSAPNSRFAAEYDIIADTVKIRRAGFTEAERSDAMFLRLFARYRAERVIP
jgi:nucleoside-diphosphate-sugar epimerase